MWTQRLACWWNGRARSSSLAGDRLASDWRAEHARLEPMLLRDDGLLSGRLNIHTLCAGRRVNLAERPNEEVRKRAAAAARFQNTNALYLALQGRHRWQQGKGRDPGFRLFFRGQTSEGARKGVFDAAQRTVRVRVRVRVGECRGKVQSQGSLAVGRCRCLPLRWRLLPPLSSDHLHHHLILSSTALH